MKSKKKPKKLTKTKKPIRKRNKDARRNKKEFPALDSLYMPKVRREYLDMDYLHKLSEKEKAWLNKFVDEELNASFKNDKSDLNKAKKQKKRIFNQNNARNRCLYGVTKINGLLMDESYIKEEKNASNPNTLEDALIEYIDTKDSKKES